MEFDIGNILYILITIVVVIVGLLGKKKKAARQGTGVSEDQVRPGFLENLEKAFSFGQPEPMVVDLKDYQEDIEMEEERVEPFHSTVKKAPSLVEEYEKLLAEQRGSSMQKDSILSRTDIPIEAMEIISLDDEAVHYFEVGKDFDAAKAVVYSAIINRVDYS